MPWGIIFPIFLVVINNSCKEDLTHESPWINYPISGYIEQNKEEYSKFYRIMNQGKLANILYGYNPHGEGYTLFLPTDEAIEHFIQQLPYVSNFEELMLDTGYISEFALYHAVNGKIRTDDFPFGALTDTTFTGDRLAINYDLDTEHQIIKINNVAPIIKANLQMTNGYIHVISEVLQKPEISGYEWLQDQEAFSIMAQAMEITGMKDRLTGENYTFFIEPDSIYNRNGIYSLVDLLDRFGNPEVAYTNWNNPFYQFTAFHILQGIYYLNDISYGDNYYPTMSMSFLRINFGEDIMINPGVQTFDTIISESNDTILIDYVRLDWDDSNIITSTGPVHLISDILSGEPFPGEIKK